MISSIRHIHFAHNTTGCTPNTAHYTTHNKHTAGEVPWRHGIGNPNTPKLDTMYHTHKPPSIQIKLYETYIYMDFDYQNCPTKREMSHPNGTCTDFFSTLLEMPLNFLDLRWNQVAAIRMQSLTHRQTHTHTPTSTQIAF